jgi:hypothetical protein
MDCVLTSPPYLNAIDYLRCSKFSLVWMGHSVGEIRAIRGGSVGSEVGTTYSIDHSAIRAFLPRRSQLSDRDLRVFSRYVDDVERMLAEITRVTRSRARVTFVVGENAVRGTFIPTARIVVALALHHELGLIQTRRRSLPANRRYLPPPTGLRNALDGRMRREVVLDFQRN